MSEMGDAKDEVIAAARAVDAPARLAVALEKLDRLQSPTAPERMWCVVSRDRGYWCMWGTHFNQEDALDEVATTRCGPAKWVAEYALAKEDTNE